MRCSLNSVMAQGKSILLAKFLYAFIWSGIFLAWRVIIRIINSQAQIIKACINSSCDRLTISRAWLVIDFNACGFFSAIFNRINNTTQIPKCSRIRLRSLNERATKSVPSIKKIIGVPYIFHHLPLNIYLQAVNFFSLFAKKSIISLSLFKISSVILKTSGL